MELSVDMDRGVGIITPSGDLVASTADRLRAEAAELTDKQCRYVVLDLSQVSVMDSSGLSACIAVHNLLRERAGVLVCAKPSATVEKVFRATRADRRLTVVAGKQDGVNALLARMGEAG